MKHIKSFILLGFYFFVLLFLSNCRTEPKQVKEDKVEFKRTVNSVIVSERAEPDVLNPPLTNSGYALYTIAQMFQTLQAIDPETMEFVPVLAKSKPLVEQIERDGEIVGTNYTFEIKEDAVWDNGSPITAQDVIFSIKVILNPKVPANLYVPFLEPIREIILFDGNPKKFTMSMEGNNINNEANTSAGFYVLPEYHYDPDGLMRNIALQDLLDREKVAQLTDPNLQAFADAFTQPKFAREVAGISGSGPYKLKEWTTGERTVLAKKADWWGAKYADDNAHFQAKVDEIIYQPIADQQTAAVAVQDEQVDVRAGFAPSIFTQLMQNEVVRSTYNLEKIPTFNYGLWYINTRKEKLSDKRVRRALAHLFDVDGAVENIHNGLVTRVVSPVLPSMLGYDESLQPINFNIESAKILLSEAGWEDTNDNGIVDKEINGESVEMNVDLLYVSQSQTQQSMGLLFKEDALKAGVNVELVGKESIAHREDMQNRNFDLVQHGVGIAAPSIYDPKQSWHTASDVPGGGNISGFGNADTDRLIDEIRTTLEEEKRAALYQKFQQKIYDEQPAIFLYGLPNFTAIHKRFDALTTPLRPGYFPGTFGLILN